MVSLRPDSPACRRLVEALDARALSAIALTPAALPAAAASLDLALCRLPSGTPPHALLPLSACERAGLAFMNRPSRVLNAHDKGGVLERLAQAGLRVIPTVIVVRDAPADLDGLPGDRFVVKPLSGAAGRGVTLGMSRADARARAEAFAEASGPVLVQPQLGDGTDLRLFVVDGEIVASMVRTPARPGGRGSLLYGATAAAHEPRTDEAAAALTAVRTLGLDIAGIDLLRPQDDEAPIILEANACPGLTGIEAATGRDVAGAIADGAIRSVRRR